MTLPQHQTCPNVPSIPPDSEGYVVHRGELLESFWNEQAFSIDQPVWVCKSKGRKRGEHHQHGEEGEQRSELFLRARIQSFAPESDRITVVYPKGSTYRVKKTHLWTILPHPGHVIVWPETPLYRRCCIQHTLIPQEYFVEIGCDYGITPSKVAAAAAVEDDASPFVLGIDKSTESIAVAKDRYPHIPFVQWDVLEEEWPVEEPTLSSTYKTTSNDDHHNHHEEEDDSNPQQRPRSAWEYLKKLHQQTQQHDDNDSESNFSSLVVAIDINGNRELEAVQACVQKVQALWRPRLIIVKSRALHSRLVRP